ncbi:MAG: RNA polymerase sigma-70 factor [Phaeodactylibacter sp.]|nr:RNA polymerase sigma-70 factor [Phaeodactylibacter sp.]
MSDQQAQELLRRIQADDQTALKQLFRECYRDVYGAILRLVRDTALSNDLAQNVFVRFWEKRQKLEVTSSLSAYLRRMAINEAIAHLRKVKRLEPVEEVPETGNAHTGEDTLIGMELQDNIHQAIDTLPPKCKLIFKLSRFEELSYREIAEQLELSVKTVENQMGKALRLLREQLKEYL